MSNEVTAAEEFAIDAAFLQHGELINTVRCAGCGRMPEEIDAVIVATAEQFGPSGNADLPEMAAHWWAASERMRRVACRVFVLASLPTVNIGTGAFACDLCWLISGCEMTYIPNGAEWPKTRVLFRDAALAKGMRPPYSDSQLQAEFTLLLVKKQNAERTGTEIVFPGGDPLE